MVWVLLAAFVGCTSKDVDLGGTSSPDASASFSLDVDAGPVANLCEPCEVSTGCPGDSVCGALYGDNMFCGATCPLGSECGADEHCALVLSAEGDALHACIPNSGTCGEAPPTIIDGQSPTACGPLSGPPVPADCRSCQHTDARCQENGCYAGWWCDTRSNHCQRPPTSCP